MKRIYSYPQGRAGLGHFIENELEYLNTYDEDSQEYLNSLSENEYNELLDNLSSEIESDEQIWEVFDNSVSYYFSDKLDKFFENKD